MMKRQTRSTARRAPSKTKKSRPSAWKKRGQKTGRKALGRTVRNRAARRPPKTAKDHSKAGKITKSVGSGGNLTASEKEKLRELLIQNRERISGQVTTLQDESLQRYDTVNSEEDGSDAFERQFALNLASSEQDALFQIDEALHRLDEGTYGICEKCGKQIKKTRLRALPFVNMCLTCQTEEEAETSKTRHTRYPTTTPTEADLDNSSPVQGEE